ncbi:MFS transporter [Gryllotalpicola koreensis]|uniref:MFS transporter n=1 Tax=Gryllotalpicola koreensis TaxID=993086 RepID=A0ABP7ZT30_9MICO
MTSELALTAAPRAARLPRTAAFAASAAAFASLYLAAGAPTPLLVVYQREWGFPEWALTVAFAAYSGGLLAALLVVGSLSDRLGRRPVVTAALVLEVVAMLMFFGATGIGWVIAARIVQGVATGAATSAFSAWIVELAPESRKRLGALLASLAPAAGLGLGALLTGAAVQLTAHASQIVFGALALIMVFGALAATLAPETAARERFTWRSLAPRVSVPGAARREFAGAIPVHIATWMVAGLFFGLVPTVLGAVFHSRSGLLSGATTFAEPAAATIAGYLLGRFLPRRAVLIGTSALAVGAALIAVGIVQADYVLLVSGGAVAGVGFGTSFSGALRGVLPLARPDERAGLSAAVYVVAYLSFGVPAIIAGQVVGAFGLRPVAVGYAVAIVVAAAIGFLLQWRLARAAIRA